jgi:tellurite resistance protein
MNEGGSKGSQTLYQYQQGVVPDNMKNVLLAGIGSQIGLPLEALIARGYIGAVSKDIQVSTEKLAMEELIKNLQGLDESIQSLDSTTQSANDTTDKLWQQNQNYENIYRIKVDTTSQEYLDAQTKKAAEEYWQTRLPNEVIGNPDYNKQLAIQQGMPSYRIYGQRYGLGEYDLGPRLQNPWTGDQMPYANPADPTGYWSEWGRQATRTDLTAQASGSADQSWKETDVRNMSPTEAIRLLQAGNLTADDKQFLQLVATGWYQQQHNAGTQDPYFGTWGTSQINQWLGQKMGVGSGVPIPAGAGVGSGTLNNYNLSTGPNVNLGGGGNVYINNEINIDTVNGVEDFEEVVTKVQTKQFKALGMNVQETD